MIIKERTEEKTCSGKICSTIQGVSQKSIPKKVKSNNEKTLNFLNLNFELAEGAIIQLSTVKISIRKKASF